MKALKTLTMVAVAGLIVMGAEAAQAGPLDFLNPFTWGNNNYYNNTSFSSGTICGPNGCYTPTASNCANGQCYPTYGTTTSYYGSNCANGQCYPSTTTNYGSTYAVPSNSYYGISNCPGGVCPPAGNTYYSNSTPSYYQPLNNYSAPAVRPVSGTYALQPRTTGQPTHRFPLRSTTNLSVLRGTS
ncbi:MAG: hypothetical protein R3C11_20090 [Planctomycetaceae bacterium]